MRDGVGSSGLERDVRSGSPSSLEKEFVEEGVGMLGSRKPDGLG